MKIFYASFLLILVVSLNSASAQEVDSIPIDTKGLDIKLKRSPLPSRTGNLNFKPVQFTPVVVGAKVNYWKTRTAVGINFNQAVFSNNWTGGGVNSIGIMGTINYKAEYSKENYSYVSELILEYGKVKNKGQLEKKTRDRIFWDNKAAIQLSKNWYFFGSLTFESQFDRGFKYATNSAGKEEETLISRFMAPGTLTESMGFEYKPNKYFSTRIGTGTARQTFVLDTNIYKNNNSNYGVERGKTFKNDLAFQVVSNFEKEVFTNFFVKSRYSMFIPYDKSLKYIDHRLDLELRSKLNRLMEVKVTCVGLYDRDNDKHIQASQILGLGVMFVFPR
ncbi:DUF3078 domain-containing protein [Pedobacter sp. N36a]|uniref:DUF3078 domain-containing protein n=1 Tax=Pedobacter sp. N36a TaxID=2767996 RepID=UPI0016573D74|nr:DUF3078 domain-containing protein [Pedobacter sp. N36a]MBC8987054.1 DUF3078 domain-containing protein [Pedobacter sp. N36a]